MVKSSKKALAVLLAVACLITFMPAMASQSFAAKKLTVKPAKKTIYVKKSFTLKANQKVKWSASKSSLKVVKLTSKKAKSVKVTGKKAGKAVVTAKVGKQTKKVTITVKKAKKVVKKTAVTAVALSADNAKDPAKEVLVGTKLRAAVTPENATVTYQWKADGTAIADATKSTFTVTTAEIGKAITVEATGTGNFEKTAVSTATAKVSAVTIKNAPSVKKYVVDANGKGDYTAQASALNVGDQLKVMFANDDLTGADASDAVTFQWYRTVTGANGDYDVEISGATSETYTVAAADKGAKGLYVLVTPKAGVTVKANVNTDKNGAMKVTTISSGSVSATVSVAIQADGKDAGKAVTLGTALTAVVTPSDANVTYQWRKNGVAIKDATSASYTPTEKGSYSVTIALANNEPVYTATGSTLSDSVKVTDSTIDDVVLKDASVTTDRTNVLVGDKLDTTVYTKVNGKDATLKDTDFTKKYYVNGQEIKSGVNQDGTIAPQYKLVDSDESINFKVGDVITVEASGTGNYEGFKKTSNGITINKLGTAVNHFKDITASYSTNPDTTKASTITVSGLTPYVKDGFTVTIKQCKGVGSNTTWTTLATFTENDVKDGSVILELAKAVNADGHPTGAELKNIEITVSGANYEGVTSNLYNNPNDTELDTEL